MRKLEHYISSGGKRLRCGYTTGTCAAAATSAAAELLLGGVIVPSVVVSTPAGIEVVVDVEETDRGETWATCAVRKDAGDDPDITDGVLVMARVALSEGSDVVIDGGFGVGRVTKPGLDQGVGEAAINSVPRAMIREAACAAAEAHGYTGGLAVTISIPDGVELAKRTFNPRLGIEGGISVLGTSGIVRPMSEDALISSIKLELKVLRSSGVTDLVLVPGNYGHDFAVSELGLTEEHMVSCSNYLGVAIDEAALLGFETLLLVGHIGKLAKVASGAMNMHSRVADGRAETLAAHAAMAGASAEDVALIMEAPTTDAMLDILAERDLLEESMTTMTARLGEHVARRAASRLRTEVVVFSKQHGLLGASQGAAELMERHRGVEGERR